MTKKCIEAIAVWLEIECDEQYLADRVRAGDYAKEKGHKVSNQCALVTDDVGDHQSPHFRKELDVDDYKAQPAVMEQKELKQWLYALEQERDNYFHGETDGAPEYLYEAIAAIKAKLKAKNFAEEKNT